MKYSVITIFLLIVPLVTATEFSEIMYNPEGSDNNKEYIEVITDLDLTGFTIQDQASEDTLELLQESDSNFALIVEEGFDYTGINASVYSAGATIGNNLNNDGDFIILKNEEEIFDTVHYYSEWGADNNGKSLCKIENLWRECLPTPGAENTTPSTDVRIIINEFLPDPEGHDDAPMPEGEWIELFNQEDYEIDLTDYRIRDNSGKRLIISDQNTESTVIQPNSFLVVYTNGFSGLLNNEGFERVKLQDPEENTIDETSYSFTKEGVSISLKEGNWILTAPSPGEENLEEDENKESIIKIKKIYKQNIKFGDTFTFRIEVYKGETSKEAINAYVESKNKKISKTSKINLNKRFQNYIITIPIQLDLNCNKKLKDGDYKLVVEGLDTGDKEFITINGVNEENCKIVTEECSTQERNLLASSESNINGPECLNEVTKYESKNTTAKRSALILFSLILILIILQIRSEKWK